MTNILQDPVYVKTQKGQEIQLNNEKDGHMRSDQLYSQIKWQFNRSDDHKVGYLFLARSSGVK